MTNAWHIERLLRDYYVTREQASSLSEQDDIDKIYSKAIQLQCDVNNYGDIFTLDDFIDCVDNFSICDYDGSGYFINDDGERVGAIKCDVKWLEKHSGDCKYIVWYNK